MAGQAASTDERLRAADPARSVRRLLQHREAASRDRTAHACRGLLRPTQSGPVRSSARGPYALPGYYATRSTSPGDHAPPQLAAAPTSAWDGGSGARPRRRPPRAGPQRRRRAASGPDPRSDTGLPAPRTIVRWRMSRDVSARCRETSHSWWSVVGRLGGSSVGRSVGGRRRIRTSVGYAGDFTDRSLWPLGHPPGITAEDSKAPRDHPVRVHFASPISMLA